MATIRAHLGLFVNRLATERTWLGFGEFVALVLIDVRIVGVSGIVRHEAILAVIIRDAQVYLRATCKKHSDGDQRTGVRSLTATV